MDKRLELLTPRPQNGPPVAPKPDALPFAGTSIFSHRGQQSVASSPPFVLEIRHRLISKPILPRGIFPNRTT